MAWSTVVKGEKSNAYIIDLERFGITQGAMGKPPYSLEKWEKAYKNLLGFNNALKYANEKGYGEVVVPRGVYSFCYTNLNGGSEIYQMINTSIKPFSHQTFNLNGSQFEMMYDSINKNPYDLSPSTTPAWKLSGKLIEVLNCEHTHVINGKIIGDIPNRSFSDGGTGFESEYGMEQTYGIYTDRGSKHCSTDGLDVSMFMGDGISMGCYPTNTLTWNISGNSPKSLPGYYDNTGAKIVKAGAYVSEKFPLIRGVHKEIQMRSGGGYVRIPPIVNKTFEYIFFDNNGNIVQRKKAVYLQLVTVPISAYTVAIQLINEAVGLTDLTIAYAITMPQARFITIRNCDIHDNHRGGISGGADFSFIEKCEIYQNGMDSGIGVPVFPDTTRYAINFEDSYSNFLTIKNCHIHSGYNSVLGGAFHILLQGNHFQSIAAPYIYNNSTTVIDDNTFDDCGGFGITHSVPHMRRSITFTNNTLNTRSFVVNTTEYPNTFVKIVDNIINVDQIQITGNVVFSNNDVLAFSGSLWDQYDVSSIDCKTCKGNIFENFNGNFYRFFVSKEKSSDSVLKNNIFRNVNFNGVNLYNNVEFKECEFYNCDVNIPVKTKSANSSLLFDRCLLQDTSITSSAYINDTTNIGVSVKVIFDDTKIILAPNFPKNNLINTADNNVTTRTYEVELNNATFDNQVTSKNTRLLAYQTGAADQIPNLRKVTIEDSRLSIADISKFGFIPDSSNSNPANITTIKNTKFKGFSTVPSTTTVKTEVYVPALTKL